MTFNVDNFCHDLAKKLPRVWKHVLGVQTLKNNKQMELNFDEDEPMTYLQQHGLDTHDRHIDFIPDQPRVTTVSLWGIPLEMPETSVDENMQRFGDIKARYKSKKNIWGKLINTGIRVYSIILKKPIPKHLTMGGFNIRTKYTGQDKHIQQDRDEKNKLRQQRQDEQNKRGEEEESQYEREEMGEFRQTLQQLKQQQQQQPQHEEEQRH